MERLRPTGKYTEGTSNLTMQNDDVAVRNHMFERDFLILDAL